ncbi:MAG: ankyrin repeat domain-containing protein [Micavibrio sp.]|nr:ankyrin repeat domain-containing protein [Micavibrio sp.]
MTAISTTEQKVLDNLLVEAVEGLDIDRAKIYVRKGANVHTEIDNVSENFSFNGAFTQSSGRAALFHRLLAYNFSKNMADFLIGEGVDVDVKNFNGNTPLMISVKGGKMDRVKYFLSKGADPLAMNTKGEMVLDVARKLDASYCPDRQSIIDALVAALDDAPAKKRDFNAVAANAEHADETATQQGIKPLKTVTFGNNRPKTGGTFNL